MKRDSATSQSRSVDRRRFLQGAAAGAAIMGGRPLGASSAPPARPAALPPTEAALARETQAIQRTPAVESYIVERPASDHMVDVLRALDLEYCTSNPGSSFDGLQESIVNYGDNLMPEFLTCLHEESAVAMAHGYAKVEGKPMMAPSNASRNGESADRSRDRVSRRLLSGLRQEVNALTAGKARRGKIPAVCDRGATQLRRDAAPVECGWISTTGCERLMAGARDSVRHQQQGLPQSVAVSRGRRSPRPRPGVRRTNGGARSRRRS